MKKRLHSIARPVAPTAFAAAVAVVLVLPGLAGCDTMRESVMGDDRPCPPAVILADASRVSFTAPDGTITARGEISGLSAECDYDDAGARVELSLRIDATLGDAALTPNATFDYFVAVLDQDENVTSKQVFSTTIRFADGAREGATIEQIEPVIPLESADADAGLWSVVTGFQLSDQQLRFNRRERAPQSYGDN